MRDAAWLDHVPVLQVGSAMGEQQAIGQRVEAWTAREGGGVSNS
jgi:hypothetical protein